MAVDKQALVQKGTSAVEKISHFLRFIMLGIGGFLIFKAVVLFGSMVDAYFIVVGVLTVMMEMPVLFRCWGYSPTVYFRTTMLEWFKATRLLWGRGFFYISQGYVGFWAYEAAADYLGTVVSFFMLCAGICHLLMSRIVASKVSSLKKQLPGLTPKPVGKKGEKDLENPDKEPEMVISPEETAKYAADQKKLTELVDKADKDKSGTINFDEMKTFCGDQISGGLNDFECEALFVALDGDEDGELSTKEFRKFLEKPATWLL